MTSESDVPTVIVGRAPKDRVHSAVELIFFELRIIRSRDSGQIDLTIVTETRPWVPFARSRRYLVEGINKTSRFRGNRNDEREGRKKKGSETFRHISKAVLNPVKYTRFSSSGNPGWKKLRPNVAGFSREFSELPVFRYECLKILLTPFFPLPFARFGLERESSSEQIFGKIHELRFVERSRRMFLEFRPVGVGPQKAIAAAKIVKISVLNDFFEQIACTRKEYRSEDSSPDSRDTFFGMSVFAEKLFGDIGSEDFVLRICRNKPRIMKEGRNKKVGFFFC